MVVNDPIGLVLLAAGGSSRLGRPKQLVEYRGRPLLRRAAETALASLCRPVVVVLGAEEEKCRAVLQGLDLTVVVNADWREGMASSIRAGIAEMEKADVRVSAIVLCVCDQPKLTVGVLNALGDQYRQGAKIAAAEYGGQIGVPALFDEIYFRRLKALRGDDGARGLLREQPEAVARVPFPGGEADVDSPADCPPR